MWYKAIEEDGNIFTVAVLVMPKEKKMGLVRRGEYESVHSSSSFYQFSSLGRFNLVNGRKVYGYSV